MNALEKRVLVCLCENPDGLTAEKLGKVLQTRAKRTLLNALRNTFGVYVDRWEWAESAQDYVPVYCVADVPQDTPKPEKLNVEVANTGRVFDADAYAAIHVDRRVHRLTVDERGIAY